MARATATVLFTDLVASTELSVAHGTAFDEARRAHDAALRSVVEARGGTVIKGTGDGIMATFGAVGDGVAAARAAQQAIHRLNRRRGDLALAIRAGLSVGDISFEGGDCYGEAVVQAARLCAIADGDQILAVEQIRAFVGGSRAEGFGEVGPRELKGLPGTVDVVEVRWDRPEASATPLPTRLADEDPTFVGRSDELGLMDEAFRAAADGRERRVVLVGGEPGVGKTTVVSRAIRGWFDAGAAVAMGRCEEDVRAPYRPFVEALGHLVASAPLEVLRGHVERHGAGLLPLVPGLASRIEQLPETATSDLETERFLLFASVGDLLATLSEAAPVVLFLDDLHWADAGTVSLLRSIATTAGPARLLVLGTLRSDELTGEHPMGQALAAFHRVPAVTRLQLEGLRSAEVVELLEHWAGSGGHDATERLADQLVAETGGNAFFVTEVIRHLDQSGQLATLGQVSTTGAALVPESIREVLAERVARLGSVADDVLATAAVIGSEFDLPLLSAVTGLSDAKLLGILEDAAAAALVREVREVPGRFVFVHALVQHAIVLNLGATREAALHRRVAEVLETGHHGGMPLAELAHHWLQATNVSDTGRARDWAVQAGDAALAALAPGDAVAFYRQALLLHDQLRGGDAATRIDLLTKLGTAERQAGDPEHRDTLLKAGRLARRAQDGGRLAEAALANNSGTFSTFQGVDTDRVEMLEAAISTVAAAGDTGRQALLLGTLANELTYSGDFDQRRRLADEALRAARGTGDAALLLRVINLVFFAIWVPDTLPERLALTDESLTLVATVDDPLVRYWAASSSCLNLFQAGRVDEGDAQLRELRRLADRLAQPALLWRVLHTEATRHLLAGDPDLAEGLALQSLEVGRAAGEPAADVYFKSQSMCLQWQRGTLPELSARIKGTAPRPPNAVASLCLIFTEGGREDEAAALLDGVAADGLDEMPRDPAYISALALFAESAVHLGHAGSASLLYDRLLPFADQIGFDGVMTVGALQHHLGGLAAVLGRPDEAVDLLQRSVAVHEKIGATFFAARSRDRLNRAR